MGLIQGVTLKKIESIQGGMAEFYTPQSSDETMIVKVPANSIDDLFVHKHQTDQLLVVKGSFVLVVLFDRKYQYIALSEDIPQVVTIPKGVLHKGRALFFPTTLFPRDVQPCFASKKAKKHYYDAIWISRIQEIQCHSNSLQKDVSGSQLH